MTDSIAHALSGSVAGMFVYVKFCLVRNNDVDSNFLTGFDGCHGQTGVIAMAMLYPLENIRTRLQVQGLSLRLFLIHSGKRTI